MKILKHILLTLALAMCFQTMDAQTDRQHIRNGNKLYREQNYAKAETEYRKALGRNSRNAQAQYNLGCALMQQQKDSSAVVYFENAGKSETAHKRKAMAYHNIGVICQKHQLYGEAIEAYKESLRNNPSDHETRYNLALCKRLAKNQPKNNEDKNKDKDKNNGKNKNKNQKDNQNQKQDPSKDKQQPKDQMSKENAEQLLNYAVQKEKATQQRLKQQQQQPQHRRLQKNW
ncbi:MAG: tetratricopeptide repeat protein [Prevotella sp.]|jgi:hypothetical protein